MSITCTRIKIELDTRRFDYETGKKFVKIKTIPQCGERPC
jgi:hypothetical protein